MRRNVLSLFLTLLILISVGGAVSIVGAASHVAPGQISQTTMATTPQLSSTALTAATPDTSVAVGSAITKFTGN